jgi:hypothetical protein
MQYLITCDTEIYDVHREVTRCTMIATQVLYKMLYSDL